MTGKVYLVGAGPGDPGLFTLKGRAVLDRADVVVYDALVGPGVLAMAPAGAKLIDVGKRAGNHKMPQEEMNKVLLEEALAGNVVVRLKGGDPFLFGRGGEELELLAEHGVPFEIVPGITSAISVPAYNGIPVTHRDFVSSLHIVTGHKRKGLEYDIDFEALVRTGGTLVFLMGVTSLEDICGGLVAAGMDPKTPAAVLQEGTTAGQRRVVADLETLKEEADRANIQAPAIIVVGKVCALAEKFYWYERLPLAGLRVVVTRPKELISGMSERLRRQGAEVIEMPAIRTQPVDPNPALEEVFARIASGGASAAFDFIVFTSPSGVRIFFDAFLKEHDIRALAGIRVAAIGKGSEKALAAYGLKTDFVPSVYDGETLGRELAATLSGGERVLIPRARIGNAELVEELEKAGAQVTDIPTYDTIHEAAGPVDVAGMLAAGRIDACVFTSASTVTAFAEALSANLPDGAEAPDFTKVTAVCIGKQTKARADALGMKTIMSEKATMDSVIEKITEKAAELRSAKNV